MTQRPSSRRTGTEPAVARRVRGRVARAALVLPLLSAPVAFAQGSPAGSGGVGDGPGAQGTTPAGQGLVLPALALPAISFEATAADRKADALSLGTAGGLSPVVNIPGAVPGETSVNPNSALPLPSSSLGTGVVPAGAAGVAAGPFFVFPTVGATMGYTDNVNARAGSSGSSFFGLSPRIVAGADFGPTEVALGYESNFTRFSEGLSKNFDQHQFTAASNSQLSARSDLRLASYALFREDTAGSVDRTVSDPQKWRGLGLFGTFGYGAPKATGRVEFDAGITDKSYDDSSAGNLFDSTSTTLAGRFLYRIAPRTQLLTELQYRSFDFGSGSDRDNTETRLRVGAMWNMSAVTTGVARIGYAKKDFDSARINDWSGLDYDILVTWTPRTYSSVGVFANRSPVDSTGTGDYRIVDVLGAAWTHQFNSQVSSRVFASWSSWDYSGVVREDTIKALGAGVNYVFRRWMRLGAQWTFEDRNSDDASFTYRRNVYTLTAGFSL